MLYHHRCETGAVTHPLAAVGCIICGASTVVASITVERNGILAHYPTCAAHIDMAVRRVAADIPELADPAVIVHHHVEVIDTTATDGELGG